MGQEQHKALADRLLRLCSESLKRFPVEMNRDNRMPAAYPPHPEEGASTCPSEKRNRCVAPVSKDGAAPWFETPRTRLRNLGNANIAAPHHEAEKGPRVDQIDRNLL